MDNYLVKPKSCRSEAPSITLETDLTSCPVCLIGEPKEINRSTKSKIIVYTRDGTLLAEHKEKRCNNRNCRVGAYYGYIVIRGGDRIYLPNCLNNEFLVVSSQTAFHINYLLEVVTDLHLLQVRHFYVDVEVCSEEISSNSLVWHYYL